MDDTKTFQYLFILEKIKIDNREFRQDSDLFTPGGGREVWVEVRLPRENEYVTNLSEISIKELAGEAPEQPVLTPKGFAYIKEQLESAFHIALTPNPEAEKEAWVQVVETEKTLNPEKVVWEEPFQEGNKSEEDTSWNVDKESWDNE